MLHISTLWTDYRFLQEKKSSFVGFALQSVQFDDVVVDLVVATISDNTCTVAYLMFGYKSSAMAVRFKYS